MEGVTVVEHPLVQHKLTLIRDKERSTKSFRGLLKEIGMLLCYEVSRDLPLTTVEIETPLARTTAAPELRSWRACATWCRRHGLRTSASIASPRRSSRSNISSRRRPISP